MKLNTEGNFRRAVRAALAVGVAGAGVIPTGAGAQDTNAAPGTKLETIEVTGSRIRRVDMETASPLVTISRDMIETSGVTTLGDLVQQLPAISGNATNTQVNNGG